MRNTTRAALAAALAAPLILAGQQPAQAITWHDDVVCRVVDHPTKARTAKICMNIVYGWGAIQDVWHTTEFTVWGNAPGGPPCDPAVYDQTPAVRNDSQLVKEYDLGGTIPFVGFIRQDPDGNMNGTNQCLNQYLFNGGDYIGGKRVMRYEFNYTIHWADTSQDTSGTLWFKRAKQLDGDEPFTCGSGNCSQGKR